MWFLLGCVWFPQYIAEAEGNLQRARTLIDVVQKEKAELLNQLEEEKRYGVEVGKPVRGLRKSLPVCLLFAYPWGLVSWTISPRYT